MFLDKAKIYVKGGDGGNGAVSFRREKYVPQGGPDGGDGGKGGDVILVVDEGLRTLMDFRYRRHFVARNGAHGRGKNMRGADGEDELIRVPPGTVIRDANTGDVIADLIQAGQQAVVARGGRGGRGNAHYVTSVRRAPAFAERGEPGESRWITLELKLLADVGLIGLPNAGKSTLLSRASAARPKIADYPFTTIVPVLGVVFLDEGRSFVMADLPGLIEGAHRGQGLGHEFLRHVERTGLLIHVLDVSGIDGRDPVEDFHTINNELALYKPELARKPQIVAANKMDLPGAEDNFQRVRSRLSQEGYEVLPVSALTGRGVPELMSRAFSRLAEVVKTQEPPARQKKVYKAPEKEGFYLRYENGVYIVEGEQVQKLVAMTDLDNREAIHHLQHRLKKLGVEEALRAAGAARGDTIRIGNVEFEFDPALR